MAKGISIGIAADTKPFSQGVKSGVIAPLDDVEKTLNDVRKAGDKQADSLVDGLKDAQKATKNLAKENDKLADDIKTNSREASRSLQTNFTEGTNKGKESFKELGNEARQNASETFSSFDGSASSFADGLQGTLGGIVSSLGPIGAVAGAAGALGIGLITSAFQAAQVEADKLKQRTSDAFDDMVESGKNYASQDFINASIKDQLDPENADAYKKSLSDAKQLHLDIGTILLANAGDAGALLEVQHAVSGQLGDQKVIQDNLSQYGKQAVQDANNQSGKLGEIASKYDAISASNDTAASKAKVYLDTTNQTAEGTKKIKDNVDGIGNKVITVTADTTAADAAILRLARQKVSIKVDGTTRNGVQIF